MVRNTFKKNEKLCARKLIDRMFTEGESFLIYPFKVVYMPVDVADVQLQLGISVSKRYHRKAVTRNRIKRQTREAYRLNKHELVSSLNEMDKKLVCMLVFVAKTEVKSEYLHAKLILTLNRLKDIAEGNVKVQEKGKKIK